jgi:restriction endonuclease S subunit
VEKILTNWKISEFDFIKPNINYNYLIIDDFASVGTGSTPSREVKEYFEGKNNWVLTSEVAMNEISSTSEKLSDKAIQDYGLKIYPENTILIAMYGQGKTRGQSALLKIPASITQNCGAIVVNEEIALPKYVWFYIMSIYEKIRSQDYSGGGVPHLNLAIIKQIRVPLPDIILQKQIISELEAQIQIFNGLRIIKTEAENKIKKILEDIWGVEQIEKNETIIGKETV